MSWCLRSMTSDRSLMAARFDLDRLESSGSRVALWRGLGLGAFGVADIALSSNGSLLYSTDNNSTIAQPTWVSRDGAATPVDTGWPDAACCDILAIPPGVDSASRSLVATPVRERSPALSPDGKWLAYVSDEVMAKP